MKTAAPDAEKGMDPLKGYVIVLGVLVAVLGFLYFHFGAQRADYEAANKRAERFMTGKGLPSPEATGRPESIPDIAYEVEKYVATYKETAKEGVIGSGIPDEMMEKMAVAAGMSQERADKENTEQKRDAGYQTTTRGFHYQATTLDRFLALAFNIDQRGMYRVSELRWELAKENAQPPLNRIQKPYLKVAIRTPIQKDR